MSEYKQKKLVFLDMSVDWKSGNPLFGDIKIKEHFGDDGLPDIKARIYNPNSGDKIYLYPGCDIPRFKMKTFCTSNNVALVKTIGRANASFIGEKTLRQMYTHTYHYNYTKEELIQWMDDNPKFKDWKPIKEAIKDQDIIYVGGTLSGVMKGGYNAPTKATKARGDYSYVEILKDPAASMAILSNPNLYFQDQILKRINTGTIIDAEMYSNLSTMLKSSDGENVKLAMETMANCDYEKSCVYLLLLLKDHGGNMYKQGNRHHVNFKSLLKFFDISNLSSGSVDIDSIVECLLSRKLLNKANLDLLIPAAMQRVSEIGDSDHFFVKELKLSDQILQGLKDNILDPKPAAKGPGDDEDDDDDDEPEEWDDVSGEEEADLSSPKRSDLFISYSGLNKLLHSPQLFYKHYILGEREEKLDQHLVDGKVIHCLLLDNGSFDKLFTVVPVSLPTGNTRLVVDKVMEYRDTLEVVKSTDTLDDFKDQILDILKEIDLHQTLKTDAQRLEKIITEPSKTYYEFLKIKGDKDLIDHDTLARCKRAVEILSANKQVVNLLGLSKFNTENTQVHNELKIMIKPDDLIFGLKGIVDNLKIDHDNKIVYINDLKTTSKTIGEFQETLEYFKYNLQAAMYDLLVKEKFASVIGPEWKVVFNFVVIDRYDQVYCFEVTPDSMLTWKAELSDRLKEVEWHLRNKSFSLPYKFATSAVLL